MVKGREVKKKKNGRNRGIKFYYWSALCSSNSVQRFRGKKSVGGGLKKVRLSFDGEQLKNEKKREVGSEPAEQNCLQTTTATAGSLWGSTEKKGVPRE